MSTRTFQSDGSLVALATYPNCAQRHTGKFVGNSLLVVGRGNAELERLFNRHQLLDAVAYAADQRLAAPEAIPTVDLCDDAVLAVLG